MDMLFMQRIGIMIVFIKCLIKNKLNKTYMADDALLIRIDRLLAKHELSNKNLHANLQYKESDYRDNRRMKNGSENKKIYNQLCKNNLSKLELYRKDYKKRYNKKNGIAKLECYCENKIFNKFDHICSLVNKAKNEKTNVKKRIFKKYALPIILLSLFSLLALIMPIIFSKYNPLSEKWCFNGCEGKHSSKDAQEAHSSGGFTKIPIDYETYKLIGTVNCIYLFVTLHIALFVSIYICYKIIKYEGLKAGKSKMSAKEYYRMFKSTF
ncbi:Plasmodium exported protein, unknown function [Plasmodium vivax]|uniref:Variable surface protein n=1 Tax=Plasmodium vivax TaxID=5855 RepID=A0A565A4L9_PLAVI|nr:Plasmodium exported protein, unknown function [Plasmodium vivax]